MVVHKDSSLLRSALLADAAVSGATGLLLAAAAPLLSPWLGLSTFLLQTAGVCLLPFAGAVLILARARDLSAGRVRMVIVSNVAWVLASIALLLLGPSSITLFGYVFVAFQAAVVALFADVQWLAARQQRPAAVA